MEKDNWIAITNMKKYDERPDYKPKGMWSCLVCGTVQHGSTLHLSPLNTTQTWTCSDCFCGGTCVPVKEKSGSEK